MITPIYGWWPAASLNSDTDLLIVLLKEIEEIEELEELEDFEVFDDRDLMNFLAHSIMAIGEKIKHVR